MIVVRHDPPSGNANTAAAMTELIFVSCQGKPTGLGPTHQLDATCAALTADDWSFGGTKCSVSCIAGWTPSAPTTDNFVCVNGVWAGTLPTCGTAPAPTCDYTAINPPADVVELSGTVGPACGSFSQSSTTHSKCSVIHKPSHMLTANPSCVCCVCLLSCAKPP
jgi:hypothetical protein